MNSETKLTKSQQRKSDEFSLNKLAGIYRIMRTPETPYCAEETDESLEKRLLQAFQHDNT